MEFIKLFLGKIFEIYIQIKFQKYQQEQFL